MMKTIDTVDSATGAANEDEQQALSATRGVRRDRDPEFPYRIGDLAREFDVTLRTLRFYEDKRLLRPKRMGTTRLYSALDRERLQLILKGKKVGFALSEIRRLLSLYDFDANCFIDADAAHAMFKDQQTEMMRQQKEVDLALQTLASTVAEFESNASTLN